MEPTPQAGDPGYVALDVQEPVWERVFSVFPLVVVATKEEDGADDLAPKHMAMPLSWDNYFGFVCTPAHRTYQNARREGCFTVSFLSPDQVLEASLAAAPRCEDGVKHSLSALATSPAEVVEGVLLDSAMLHLECELDRIVDDFGRNSLIAGRIVAARVAARAERNPDVDDQDLLAGAPLLAYLYPGRYARISESFSFPFHQGFRR